MTTLMLLTPHPGGLDHDLDQKSIYSLKKLRSFNEHSCHSKFVRKNLNSTKARRLPTVNTCTEMGPAVGKKGQEIKAAITKPPIL
jgi:hypothetical protein